MKTLRQPSREPLWREEFSVNAEDERYVTRRQFTKFLTLTSLAMFAGNAWIVAKGLLRKEPVYPATPVVRIGDVPVGGVKLFNYPTAQDPCILVRPSEGVHVAYSQVCTHLSCAVYFSEKSGRLICPCHEGSFSVTDGSVIAGPPPRPLPKVILEARGSDLVAVRMEQT